MKSPYITREQDFPTEGISHGWIQWKGTDVCIDIHCLCGHHSHFDGDFLYFFECPACKQMYAVGQSVKLVPLDAEQAETVGDGFKTVPLEDD